MRTAAIVAVVVLCVCAGGSVSGADEPDWLAKVDRIRAPSDSFKFDVQVTGADNTRIEMTVRVRERTKSLVLYTHPAKAKGRALLFVERNMWVYIPGSRRPLRISPQQQVLGGVSSADVARVVFGADYAVERVEPLADEDPASYRLMLKAAGPGAAYARIDLDVAGTEARPLQAVFYSASERALKTAYFEEYRSVMGAMRPMALRLVDHLDGDAQVTLRYDNYEIIDTPSFWFQPSYLKKLQE